MRVDAARVVNFGAAALVGALLAFVVLPRVGTTRTVPEPPSIDDLHRAALGAAANSPRGAAPEALFAVAAAIADPEDRALYAHGIELLAAGHREEADIAFSVALRRERERDLEW